MISSLLHLVGLRPRVYYTLTNFRGGKTPLPPPLNAPMQSHGVALRHANVQISKKNYCPLPNPGYAPGPDPPLQNSGGVVPSLPPSSVCHPCNKGIYNQ